VRFDVGASWRPGESLEIGIWGQNLVDDRHVEFSSLFTPLRTEVPRTVLAKLSWSF
jgi:outer membrane receptor protein involved in Fe transport